MTYDITIVGAGIIGLSTAYSLKKNNPKLKILVLEKEATHSMHQSGNNSNVIHSGVYYKPNSLKAKNCIKGYELLIKFLKENDLPYEICGKLIVATDKSEIPSLMSIYKRGKLNGLKNLKLLDREEIKEYEPYVDGEMALHVPQAGITDYKLVCNKLYEILIDSNVEIKFSKKVKNYKSEKNFCLVITDDNLTFKTKKLINVAGLYSDKLAKIENNINYKIVPFRGEYYNLKENANKLVNNLIYPVPDPNFPFLGVHFTKRVDGSIESGPNAVFAYSREGYTKYSINIFELIESLTYLGFIKLARKYWKEGFKELYRSYSKKAYLKALQKLIPSIKYDDIICGNSGVRAQALNNNGEMLDDFLIINKNNIINVCNAPSPAATACFSIGEYISNLVLKK